VDRSPFGTMETRESDVFDSETTISLVASSDVASGM